MTKYLIVRCEELNDQYECDADREPMFLVDDWEKWYHENKPSYLFEVYLFEDDKEAKRVKEYDESLDKGMALYFWKADDDCEEIAPTVIAQYQDYDRDNTIPKKVWSVFQKGAYGADGDKYTKEELKLDLESCGCVSWFDKECKKYWVYGPYEDGRYCLGY